METKPLAVVAGGFVLSYDLRIAILALPAVFPNFIYERQTDSTFRMTYETMRDTVAWHEGDQVLCGRSRG